MDIQLDKGWMDGWINGWIYRWIKDEWKDG